MEWVYTKIAERLGFGPEFNPYYTTDDNWETDWERLQRDLYEKAERELQEGIHTIDAYEDAPPTGIIRTGWCGKASCGQTMEERLGRPLLGTPYAPEEFHGHCLECRDETEAVAYAAHSY